MEIDSRNRLRFKRLIGFLVVSLTLALPSRLPAQSQPGEAVFTGSGGADQFLSANPTATLVSVDQSGATYKTAKGLTLVTGPEVTTFDGSKWQVAKPQISTDGNGGWVQTGAPAKVEITGKGADKHLKLTQGASVLDLLVSKVSHVSGHDFTFEAGGAEWRLRIVPRGHEFETTVKARMGAKTWSFPYTQTGKAPSVDSKGNLVVGSGDISTSRAVMIGADKRTYPCSPWAVGATVVSFTCDDRALPDAALPYVIDPATYGSYPSSISCGGWDDGQTCHLDYHPPAETSFTASYHVTLPSGATVTGVSIQTNINFSPLRRRAPASGPGLT